MKRIIVFSITAILTALLFISCKKDPRDQYVGSYRCSYKETMTSMIYGSYVRKDLSDTIIQITPSPQYENGVKLLIFTFIIDDDGNIVDGFVQHPGDSFEGRSAFRIKGDSLSFHGYWGGLGGGTYFEVKGVKLRLDSDKTGTSN